VEPPGGVLLDDEQVRRARRRRAGARGPERLRRSLRVALGAISVETIGHALSSCL
jgi:hypothetical protein